MTVKSADRTAARVAVLVLLLSLPGLVSALGLGGVEVNSALNEPLDARIAVTATDEELATASVILASGRDFERVGLMRSSMLEFLSIRLVTDDAEPYVSVTSSDPISEPFLSFLLDVNWANGRMLREYTLLLDPPVYAPSSTVEPAPAVTAYDDEEPVSTVADEPASDDASDRVVSPTADEASTTDTRDSYVDYQTAREYGPVSAGDTLWEIARDQRPDDALTINQTMVALLRANPEAFIDNNINNLRRGSVLRIPDADEIRRITLAEAIETVRTQNALWQDYRQALSRSAPTVSDPASSSYTSSSATSASDSDARLELVPPRAGEDSGSDASALRAAGTSETVTRLREVQDELARTQEELAASEAEGEDLQSRVDDLESVVDKLQRALNLREDELAALQGQLAQSREAQDAVDAGVTEPSGVAMDTMAADATDTTTDAMDDTTEGLPGDPPVSDDATDQQPESTDQLVDDILADLDQQEAQPADQPADVTAEDTDEQSAADAEAEQASEPAPPAQRPDRPWWHMFKSPLVLGAIALLVVIAIIAFFLMRRGGGESREHDTLISGMVKKRGGAPEIEDAEAEDEPVPDLTPDASPDVMDDLALKEAIARDPDNGALHLQLAKYYFANGQDDQFVEAAETMHARLGAESEEWQEVSELGAQIMPEHVLFADVSAPPSPAPGVGGGSGAETRVLADLDDDDDTTALELEGDEEESDETPSGGHEGAELEPFEFDTDKDDDADEDDFPTLEIEDLEASLEDSAEDAEDEGLAFDLGSDDSDTIEREVVSTDSTSGDEDDDRELFGGAGLDLAQDEEDKEQQGEPEDDDLSFDFEADSEDEEDPVSFEMGDRRAVNADDDDDDVLDLEDDDSRDQVADRGDVLDEAEELLADLDTDDTANAASERPADGDDTQRTDAVDEQTTGEHPAAQVPTSEIDLDLDDDDLFGNEDPVTTKLDLARAYVDMGDPEGARNMLQEVVDEGSDEQKNQAKNMLDDLSDDDK